MRQICILAGHTIKALIRKKDMYVFFIMLLAMLGFLMAQKFFGVNDVSRFIKDIGYTCIWIFSLIIAVTFSAKQLPEEISSKTALPLLAKPVSRLQFLLGRYLGSVLASVAAYTAFYAVYIYVVFLRGGGIAHAMAAQAYLLGIFFLSVVCAVSMMLSVIMTYSAALSISFIVYFATMYFSDAVRASILSHSGPGAALFTAVYYLLPHYEFFDTRIRLAHSWGPLPLWVFMAIIAYAFAYSAAALFISYRRIKDEYL